ncbi:uncharacterized protein STAUR_6763 [Stigmatella aurantiaca DW4/3-1]|uniref:Uncharacterized protein n=1 Tax=Stigmatella aurantiaca (strain DW4/3-1) TaxID=378806 RepID=E3FRC8_STIAD|nr:uncharacterized protein STAUR_6763 [Stigmatella aurantiaca DW4/3-1]
MFKEKEAKQLLVAQMTLRDFFAGLALAGLVSKGDPLGDKVSQLAYEHAEKMLTHRAKLHASEEPSPEQVAESSEATIRAQLELLSNLRGR